MVRYETEPGDHKQGTHLVTVGDSISTSAGLRVGMQVSASEIRFFVDGLEKAQVVDPDLESLLWVGLASISNIGCQYDYLWVSRAIPGFDPASVIDLSATTVSGQEDF